MGLAGNNRSLWRATNDTLMGPRTMRLDDVYATDPQATSSTDLRRMVSIARADFVSKSKQLEAKRLTRAELLLAEEERVKPVHRVLRATAKRPVGLVRAACPPSSPTEIVTDITL